MIWIIGGTSDANVLTTKLQQVGQSILVSTTTTYGTHLAALQQCQVIEQKLSEQQMEQLISDKQVSFVLDASHPFAEQVSLQAIAVCQRTGCPYIRFEREQKQIDGASYYNDYDSLINALTLTEGNILLTTGSKNLYRFTPELSNRIVARVLAVAESIAECQRLGLLAHQVIAMKGRMSMETNRSLMKEYNISHLVSKDSGEAGGVLEKCDAALDLGISIHLLSRPSIDYPIRFSNMDVLIKYLMETRIRTVL